MVYTRKFAQNQGTHLLPLASNELMRGKIHSISQRGNQSQIGNTKQRACFSPQEGFLQILYRGI